MASETQSLCRMLFFAAAATCHTVACMTMIINARYGDTCHHVHWLCWQWPAVRQCRCRMPCCYANVTVAARRKLCLSVSVRSYRNIIQDISLHPFLLFLLLPPSSRSLLLLDSHLYCHGKNLRCKGCCMRPG